MRRTSRSSSSRTPACRSCRRERRSSVLRPRRSRDGMKRGLPRARNWSAAAAGRRRSISAVCGRRKGGITATSRQRAANTAKASAIDQARKVDMSIRAICRVHALKLSKLDPPADRSAFGMRHETRRRRQRSARTNHRDPRRERLQRPHAGTRLPHEGGARDAVGPRAQGPPAVRRLRRRAGRALQRGRGIRRLLSGASRSAARSAACAWKGSSRASAASCSRRATARPRSSISWTKSASGR